jgi:hypothetical protein
VNFKGKIWTTLLVYFTVRIAKQLFMEIMTPLTYSKDFGHRSECTQNIKCYQMILKPTPGVGVIPILGCTFLEFKRE